MLVKAMPAIDPAKMRLMEVISELYRCAVSFAGVADIEYMFSDWSRLPSQPSCAGIDEPTASPHLAFGQAELF